MSWPPNYHGSFEHPRRAFAAGLLLLVLLFGGFALGTDVSGRSTAATSTRVLLRTVEHRQVERVTVALPASTEVISGRTVVVPGPTRTRRIWVQVPASGSAAPVIGVIRELMAATASLSGSSTPPVTVLQPVTVTETQTVTETVTVTGGSTTTTTTATTTTGP